MAKHPKGCGAKLKGLKLRRARVAWLPKQVFYIYEQYRKTVCSLSEIALGIGYSLICCITSRQGEDIWAEGEPGKAVCFSLGCLNPANISMEVVGYESFKCNYCRRQRR